MIKVHESVTQATHHTSFVFNDEKVHGYELEGDLSVNYDFLDYIMLMLRGDFLDDEQKKIIDFLLRRLTLCEGNNSSLHTARATRCSGGSGKATLLTATIAVAAEDFHLLNVFEKEWLKEKGIIASTMAEALENVVSKDIAETLSIMFSSLGVLAEAFQGKGTFDEFPVSLPPFEYER